MLRRIPFAHMMNLRDLGGYPTRDGRETAWRRLLRSDAPVCLTPEEIDWLRRERITTVLDLRSPEEMRRNPCALAELEGFDYHPMPAMGGASLPPEDRVWEGYRDILADHGFMARALRILANAPGGALFHCTAGKDRTGTLAAALLLLAGVDRQDIVADYQVSHTYIKPLLERMRVAVPDLPAYVGRSDAETMEQLLDWFEQTYGGPVGYARALGLTEEERQKLLEKLLA